MAVTSKLSIQDVYGSRAGAAPRITAQVTPGATRSAQAGAQATGVPPRLASVLSQSSPVYGFIVLAVLLVALRFAARAVGAPEEFKGIKVNVFNAVVVTLMAMLGFFVLKVVMMLVPIPHVATVVMGA